ncbi:aspartyl protease [Ceratobasidium sp. AG-Ba]|nr:aspartyl protease [Ceratobasidium sp. AG-Ba]
MKLEAAFTILAVASTASAFTLPVTRLKSRVPQLHPNPNKRGFGTILAAGGSVGLKNTQNNIYTSTVRVKGKDLVLQVDTGSSDTWVYPTSATRDVFSDAVVYTDLPIKLSYGRGSVSGYVSQLTMDFAGYTVQNQSILLVQDQEDMSLIEANLTNGLLGLGFDTLSQIANTVNGATAGQTWGRTILSNIFISDPTTPNHIAFRLDRTDDGNTTDVGAFDVGTFASGLEAINNTAEIPIFSSSSQANLYWNVLVDGVTLNGKAQTLKSTVNGGTQTPPAGKVSAVLDTGYSLPQLSPDLAHAIYTAMGGTLVEDGTNTTYAVPCMAEAQLAFSIGGHTIPIHPLDLTQVTTVTTTDRSKNFTMCQNAFQPFSSNAGGGEVDYILGDAFLRNVYSLYDYGDFIQGFSGLAQGDPYMKLLPLTDATAASAEFKTARAASLSAAGMPPQIDPTTINGVPKALPGTGGGSPSGGGGGGGGKNGAGRVAGSLGALGLAVMGAVAAVVF